MKINFHSSFKALSPLLDAPVKQDKAAQGFGKLIGDMLDNNPVSQQKIPDEKAAEVRTSESMDGPMARFNFADPTLVRPVPEPIAPPIQENPSVNEPTETVNPPAIVEARKINASSPLNELHKADRTEQIKTMVDAAGVEHGVDPALGMAVIESESSFNPSAVSRDGFESKGLFQLLDSTGLQLLGDLKRDSEYNPFNPEQNVDLGVAYLRKLHDTFSVPSMLSNKIETAAAENFSSLEKLAVAAFNAGEGRVASAQQRAAKDGYRPGIFEHVEPYLPKTTREYVQRVVERKGEYMDQQVLFEE